MVLAPSRKTPTDLVLDPPQLAEWINIKVISAYSQEYNGLAFVNVWMASARGVTHSNFDTFTLPSPLKEKGIWGPWELCPPRSWIVAWNVKSTAKQRVTGEEQFC